MEDHPVDDDDKQRAGKIGGAKRAEVLSPARRAEIARKAAETRWGGKPPRVIHKGNFKAEFGIDVDCYVLDDQEKTAVISQRGMGESLGFSGGKDFPRLLASKVIADSLGVELREKIENPLKFQIGAGGGEQPRRVSYGFDVALLIDICKAIIAAESAGKLSKRYERLARQAHIIVGASAKAGIKHLVYALAGYNPTAEEVIAAFKLYVQAEAKKYETEFPNELYTQWHRLYDIPVPVRGKPWHFKYLTISHIYYPLAQSSGKVYALLKTLKANDGDRAKKLFQFLSEIGARALRMHLGRVLEMAESSPNAHTYEKKIVERFGGQQELDLVMPSPPKGNS
jgi:hypothetical protein